MRNYADGHHSWSPRIGDHPRDCFVAEPARHNISVVSVIASEAKQSLIMLAPPAYGAESPLHG